MVILNEHDKHAAQWLRNLIAAGHLPPGEVDERDIQELKADDLRPHKHVHLFSGIGGWPLGLRMAGWPDDRPVWTGSCPCQPFSSAGKRKGTGDERHLWPEMFRLIRECRPGVVFGEQVASAVGHGWLDGVFADLEGEGYACGAVVLGAHSVGAPHIRQRLYWVSHRDEDGRGTAWQRLAGRREQDTEHGGCARGVPVTRHGEPRTEEGMGVDNVARDEATINFANGGNARGLQHPESDGRGERRAEPDGRGVACGCGVGPWSGFTVLPFRDGKHRRIPVESSLFPLAHGVPGRVGLLRGAGNAIVPACAAEFIRAVMEVL